MTREEDYGIWMETENIGQSGWDVARAAGVAFACCALLSGLFLLLMWALS